MKAFASDFDNTLHFTDSEGEGYFRQKDLAAIQQFQKEGNLFGLCTGRPLLGFEGDDIQGPSVDFIVASTGAIVSKVENGSVSILKETIITVQQVADIQTLCEGRGELYIHADGHVYTLFEKRRNYPHQVVLDSVQALEEKHVSAISVWTPSLEMAETLTNEINKIYGNTLSAYQNVNWLDVVCLGVSKGNGAQDAKEMLHADMIAGIGDSFNDIPLLEKVDVAFSFHRCDEAVKAKADYLVDSVHEALEIYKKL